MSNVRLCTSGRDAIRHASRKEIEAYFITLAYGQRRKKWLLVSNRYWKDVIRQYENDLSTGNVEASHLIGYIAASGPVHTIDGWSYLSRAVEAALRGDQSACIHFAYYAELRAAISLLACEGIGVFHNRHPIVLNKSDIYHDLKGEKWDPKNKRYERLQKFGTHYIVWPILKYWSSLKRAPDLLEDVVLPGGHTLSDWLLACNCSSPQRAIAQHWLRTWGMDLSTADDDHDLRNIASYRPSEFHRGPSLDPLFVLEFVEELWQLFEPGGERRFPNMERFLLRRTLRAAGLGVPIVKDITKLGLDHSTAKDWSIFLGKGTDPKPLILANQTSSVSDPYCHLQVLSRAVLLLYLATCASRRLLKNARYEIGTMDSWWRKHGESHCLWDSVTVPNDPFDLWADIDLSLRETQLWRTDSTVTTHSIRTWQRDRPSALSFFVMLELIGIWGLIP